MSVRFILSSILGAACLVGCTPTTSEQPKNVGTDLKQAEADVAQAFSALQTAIRAKDADKVWDLLAKESQADAEREAKVVKEEFGKANNKEQTDYANKFGLTAKELADLTGKLYVQSRRFFGKYHEIPDSKMDKITVRGDSGKVKYIEDDGDAITQEIVREQGQWKFVMQIPKATEK